MMVAYCKTHDRYYTVYPPAWAPYVREPIVPEEQGGAGLVSWESTVFASAVDDRWLKSYEHDGKTSWHTHRRRLVRCGELLGLSGTFAVGEEVAAILVVPLHVHVAARKQFARGDLHSQRRAVRRVLDSISVTARLWRQMVRAEYAAGVWGSPWWWECNGVLEPLFRSLESSVASSLSKGDGCHP